MLDTGIEHLPDFAALGVLYREAKHRFDPDAEFADARAPARGRAAGRRPARRSRSGRTWSTSRSRTSTTSTPSSTSRSATSTSSGRASTTRAWRARSRRCSRRGVATESQGAVVVASERFTNPDGTPAVLIIRKSDGGYGYGTTDLAALRYRIVELHADRMIYVTDARQAQHFAMVFDAAERAAGWLDGARAEHVPFGTMLGRGRQAVQDPRRRHRPARRPARRGGRARPRGDRRGARLLRRRARRDRPDGRDRRGQVRRPLHQPPARPRVQLRPHARARRQHRAVPALRARPRRLDRRHGGRALDRRDDARRARRARARAQAERVRRRASTTSTTTLEPHRLCTYLYELAGAFTTFYEACPVLKAPTHERASRLALCTLTARTLRPASVCWVSACPPGCSYLRNVKRHARRAARVQRAQSPTDRFLPTTLRSDFPFARGRKPHREAFALARARRDQRELLRRLLRLAFHGTCVAAASGALETSP